MSKFLLASALGFSVLALGGVRPAAAQTQGDFPVGAAVEARLVSDAGYSPRGVHFYRPDFSVWLQVRVRNVEGEANLGVGRVTGPTGTVPASISITSGPGTLERGALGSGSNLRGRATDFRMLPAGPIAPVLTGTEAARTNNRPTFAYNGPNRPAYANGYWTARSIMGFDAIRAGAIYSTNAPVQQPESWSQFAEDDGSWSPWQNVYLVSIAGLPTNARFTLSATGSASIMTSAQTINAAGVSFVGSTSTGLRAFTTTQTFQFVQSIQAPNNMGPFIAAQPSFAPIVIPAPAPAALSLALVGISLRRRRTRPV